MIGTFATLGTLASIAIAVLVVGFLFALSQMHSTITARKAAPEPLYVWFCACGAESAPLPAARLNATASMHRSRHADDGEFSAIEVVALC